MLALFEQKIGEDNLRQLGLAKTQFQKSFQKAPWNPAKTTSRPSHDWPLIAHYLNLKIISYFDYLLTECLLRNSSHVPEEAALFLCHLILATKEGHLCVQLKEDLVFPSPGLLWKYPTGQSLSEEEGQSLSILIKKGSALLPSSLVSQVESTPCHQWPSTPICQNLNHFYLQMYWVYESLFLNYLSHHLHLQPTMELNLNQSQKDLQNMLEQGEINSEQQHAIWQSLTNSLSLITGGPGTGKTYTAGKLIQIYWKNLPPEKQVHCKIALAAPTGKAAANLQNSLTQAVSGLTGFPALKAKTLHSLLNLKQLHTPAPLNEDLILIDESSMIDIKLMAHLFKSLKKGARLVLLGDPHQLPSVEAGNAFTHLSLLNSRPNFSHTHLVSCLRTELASIVQLAELVKNGNADPALAILNQSPSGIKRLPFDEDPKKAQKQLVHYSTQFFPYALERIDDYLSLFQTFNSIRLLSPMRKGPFGVDILNQLIWQHLCQNHNQAPWVAMPILITSNDYRQELFNGENGILIRKSPLNKSQANDFAFFLDRKQEGNIRKIPLALLPKFELAYCLSVHKSQGSEFGHVILALPEGSESFGRQVFYTAITRARQLIEIYGLDTTIEKTILRQENRLSGILDRIEKLAV